MNKWNVVGARLGFFSLIILALTACGGGSKTELSERNSLDAVQANSDKPENDEQVVASSQSDVATGTNTRTLIETNTRTNSITNMNTNIETNTCFYMYNFVMLPCDPQTADEESNPPQNLSCRFDDVDSLDVNDPGLNLVQLRSPDQGGIQYQVGTLEEFNHAASVAQRGDVVVINTGTYEHWDMQIPSVGVRYVSAVGGVAFFKTASMMITGSDNIIAGFIFKEVESLKVIEVDGGDSNRITGNVFVDLGREVKAHTMSAITLKNGANYNRIDHNLMQRSRSVGIHIVLPDDREGNMSYSKNNRIDNNHFEDGVLYPGSVAPISILIGDKQRQSTLDHVCVTIDNNDFSHNELINIGGYAKGIQIAFNFFEKVKNAVAIDLVGESLFIKGNAFDKVNLPMSITSRDQALLLENVILEQAVYVPYVP
ncbi:MAG: hypothetical protein GXP14_07915 [Gammaproteobacteria bacterium]|nr:hypothetical protein [Gammaproteobacteria bacterium]